MHANLFQIFVNFVRTITCIHVVMFLCLPRAVQNNSNISIKCIRLSEMRSYLQGFLEINQCIFFLQHQAHHRVCHDFRSRVHSMALTHSHTQMELWATSNVIHHFQKFAHAQMNLNSNSFSKSAIEFQEHIIKVCLIRNLQSSSCYFAVCYNSV